MGKKKKIYKKKMSEQEVKQNSMQMLEGGQGKNMQDT